MYQEEKEPFNRLIEHIEEYLKTKQTYSKLVAIEKGSKGLSTVMSGLIIFIFLLLFIIFISLTAAYLIAEHTGKYSMGFAVVGAVYLLIGLLLYVGREQLLKTPIMNAIIKNMLKEKDDEKN